MTMLAGDGQVSVK